MQTTRGDPNCSLLRLWLAFQKTVHRFAQVISSNMTHSLGCYPTRQPTGGSSESQGQRRLVTTLLRFKHSKGKKKKCLLLQTRELETSSCVPFCSPWPTIYLLRQDGLELHNSLQRWIMMLSHLPQEPGNTLSLKPGKCLVCFMCSGKNKAWQCCHLLLDSSDACYCSAIVTCRRKGLLQMDKDV